MDTKTRDMIRKHVAMYKGDVERLARWYRDSLHIKPIGEVRRIIQEALQDAPTGQGD